MYFSGGRALWVLGFRVLGLFRLRGVKVFGVQGFWGVWRSWGFAFKVFRVWGLLELRDLVSVF